LKLGSDENFFAIGDFNGTKTTGKEKKYLLNHLREEFVQYLIVYTYTLKDFGPCT
jgi:hypothetical protein